MKLLILTSLWPSLILASTPLAGPQVSAQTVVPPQFKVVSLEPFGSDPVAASAVNNKGRVTGVTFREVGTQTRAFPFVWSPQGGFVEPWLPAGHTGASAEDINSHGDIVGFITHPSFGTRGYRWNANSFIPPQPQYFPELSGRLPLAIGDNRRTIAGQGFDAQSPAWVFDSVTGTVTDLIVGGQIVEGVNQATSVNAAGVVVGTISTKLSNGNVRPNAFRYAPGFAGWFIELLPGPTSTWYSSDAFDVTDSGEIVGSVFDPLDHSVAHWSVTGNFTDLGLASANEFVTIARAVNEDGWIVGWSPNDHPLGMDTPFLWIDGAFHDLNDLVVGLGPTPAEDAGVVLHARDVNDEGVILAELVHFSPAFRIEDVLLVPKG